MMKRFQISLPLLSLSIFALSLPSQQAPPSSSMQSASAEKFHLAGVPNSGKINNHFYRGAQPELAALAELQKLGVTTVVNLRREDPAAIESEKRQAESLGL